MPEPRDKSREISVVELAKKARDNQEKHDRRIPVQLSIRDQEGELLDELYGKE